MIVLQSIDFLVVKLYYDFQLHSNGAEEETEVPEIVEVPCRNFSGFSF
mgnify:CR=1 FL=1